MLYLNDKEIASKPANKQYSEDYFKGVLKENMSGYMDYAKQSRPLRRNFRILLSHIRRHLSFDKHISLLDIGCAYGFFLDEARKLGMSVHGVDLSKSAVQWMEENLGIKGAIGFSSDAPKGPFDVITAIEVIEHVRDPRSFLNDLRKRMKDSGILVIHTGANDTLTARLLGKWWWYLNPPDHCSIFSRFALRKLVTDLGFDIIEQGLTPYHWVGLNNMLLKLARIFESGKLCGLASKLPAFVFPVFHYTTQLLIAKKH
jgi:SAM-dependent methyltransferase